MDGRSVIRLWDANMIRAGGAALTAGSDVSSVAPVFPGICEYGLCRHLLHSGAHRCLLCVLEWVT